MWSWLWLWMAAPVAAVAVQGVPFAHSCTCPCTTTSPPALWVARPKASCGGWLGGRWPHLEFFGQACRGEGGCQTEWREQPRASSAVLCVGVSPYC